MFQVMKAGKLEKRVAALGGHGFAVFSPPGHWPISVQSARQFGRLIHETDKEKEILRSGYIGGMSRYGGVNFSVNQPGGYRKKATALITIEPQNLALAIAISLRIGSLELCMVQESGDLAHGEEKFPFVSFIWFPFD